MNVDKLHCVSFTLKRQKYTFTDHFIRYLLDLGIFLLTGLLAVASPLAGLVFRDALLHTTVVMCGYLHYCHLPVSFDQSGPSPLTSLINKRFCLQNCCSLDVFFFHHSLQTLD